jgi:hypothetical protein
MGRRLLTADEISSFDLGEVGFWCDDCGVLELDPAEAVAHAREFGHRFVADRDWFREGNEELFAWNRVAVAGDDRTLTFGAIHAPPWIAGPSPTRWAFSRVEFEPLEGAVAARVWLIERRPGEPDALDGDDPSREVTATLAEPLGDRVVVDGCAKLMTPIDAPRRDAGAARWDRVRVADERTVVVYWDGGALDLDHVSTKWRRSALVLTVWLSTPYDAVKAYAQYQATIVRLDRPLEGRRITDGAVRRWP